MPENKNNNDNEERVATLGGALFPMSLGLLAGVVLSSYPVPDLKVLQGKLSEQLFEQRVEVVQEISEKYEHASDLVLEDEVFGESKEPVVYKPHQWVIKKKTSTLSFEALQYGQKFSGSFEFDGEIIFNPEKLDDASVSIDIDIASISTGSITRDEQARTIDWFDVEAFPKATYKAAAFSKSGGADEYIAHGVLNLRGVDMPLDLPFSLKFSEKHPEIGDKELANNEVEMLAQISLSRSDLGLGQGEWKNEDVVSDNVDIFVVLQAFQTNSP